MDVGERVEYTNVSVYFNVLSKYISNSGDFKGAYYGCTYYNQADAEVSDLPNSAVMTCPKYEAQYSQPKIETAWLKEGIVKCAKVIVSPENSSLITTASYYKLPNIATKDSLLKILQQLRMANPCGFRNMRFKTKSHPLNFRTLESEGFCLRIDNKADFDLEDILMIILSVNKRVRETELTITEGRVMEDYRLNFSIIGQKDQLEVGRSVMNMFSKGRYTGWEAGEEECEETSLMLFPDTINFDVISPSPPGYMSIDT